jgi:hypothetical protein
VRQTKSPIRRKLLSGEHTTVIAITKEKDGVVVDVKYPHRHLSILRAGASTWAPGPAVGMLESAKIKTRIIVYIPTDPRRAATKEKEIVRDTNFQNMTRC